LHTREIKEINFINDTMVKLSFDKGDIKFRPGQHFSLSIEELFLNREYSVYSSVDDRDLEFLIKIVEDGILTNALKSLKKGNSIHIHGPYGNFLSENISNYKKVILVATGSGVAPYRSFLKSSKISNFQLIHGIRNTDDIILDTEFDDQNLTYCISRQKNHNHFKGRVTDYLKLNKETLNSVDHVYYICGNKKMISETYDILIDEYGVSSDRIFSETFF
tara:strand:+ start:43727 stop:44383 length:657 start_codon:yes stop_codon:yes gene_type:complete